MFLSHCIQILLVRLVVDKLCDQAHLCSVHCTALKSDIYCPPPLNPVLSVSTSICSVAYVENYTVELTKFSAHVDCGHGSVLLRRRCDTLCRAYTSCFG